MEATLRMLTLEVVRSSDMEGAVLDPEQVRMALAQRLDMPNTPTQPVDRPVEWVVEIMLDATQRYSAPLTEQRLFGWHSSLFSTGQSGGRKILVGAWRDNPVIDPLQVVSGPKSRQTVHYQAPHSYTIPTEMAAFLEWFNTSGVLDPYMAGAIAHLWFLTIHPFEDGNGRIARTITAMQLARADESPLCFYSLSAQLHKERKTYFETLERTQAGTLDITAWLEWFLQCLDRAFQETNHLLSGILTRAKFWEENTSVSFNERQKKMLNRLFDGLDGRLTSSRWAKLTESSSDTAVRDINDLLKQGILAKDPGGGRSTTYSLRR